MSHALQTVQTSKTFPRSQCQRSPCTVYPQRQGAAYYASNDLQRHVKLRRSVRTVDQTLRQDDRYLDSAIARRRCSTQSPRTRSPGDTSSRKRIRQGSKPEFMSSFSQNPASRADDESDRIVLPLSEFTAVKETLLKLFKQCSELLFLSISCAISCVLRSFRPLHRIEIAGAVILFLASRSVSTSEFACEKDLSANWLDACGEVLTEDENGYVHFAQSSVQLFLSNYQIQGVDSTHATISIICLLQVEIRISQKVRQDAQTACAKAQFLAAKAFSAYAAKSWTSHYRAVQDTRADLARKVHRILSMKWGSKSDSTTQSRFAPSYANAPVEAVEFCIKNDLHVLAELYEQGKQNSNHSPSSHQDMKAKTTSGSKQPDISYSKTPLSSSFSSEIRSAHEAFEQLDMSDSADTTSSSECEGWTKLKAHHR